MIAHVDRGKSTLADRLLELAMTVQRRQMEEQRRGDMELDRCIPIRARAFATDYKAADSEPTTST